MQKSSRQCYICKTSENPIIASEPAEHRFGKPILPEGVYRFVRCSACGTLYVDSDVTDEYLSNVYSDEEMDNDYHDSIILGSRLDEFKKHWSGMIKVRTPKAGERMLDIGCQTGEFGALAQKDGLQLSGLELSKSYAELCKKKWGDKEHVFCGFLSNAPFENGAYSYISALETLEHMCDPITAIKLIRKWLANDGILAISIPSSDYFHFKYWLFSSIRKIIRIMSFRSNVQRPEGPILPHTHIYNFSRSSVKILLKQGGFEPLNIELTGWHGKFRNLFYLITRILEFLSFYRVSFAPSIFVIAKSIAVK